MGHQTIVNGYIETSPDHDDENRAAIRTFAFDENWPLRNVFSAPVRGYRGSFIAFADGIKATPEDWPAWRDRFEELLGRLEAVAARVDFDHSEGSESACYVYVRGHLDGTAESGDARNWTRWRLNSTGAETDETTLRL